MHQFPKCIFGIKLYISRTVPLSDTCRVLLKKNKFEKLVRLVRFIVRICHDARSPERQNPISLGLTNVLI